MHFLVGLLFGYYIRGKASLLAATLVVIALLCFIVLPAIALSGLASQKVPENYCTVRRSGS